MTLGLIQYFGPGLHSFLKSERKRLQKIDSSTSGNPLSKIKKQKPTHDFQFVFTYLSGDAVQMNMLGSCVLCSRGF